jgi:hypothetical protein
MDKTELFEKIYVNFHDEITTYERRVTEFKLHREEIQKYIDIIPEYLFTAFNISYSVSSHWLWFYYPYNRILKQELVEKLLADGWIIETNYEEKDCKSASDDPFVIFSKDDLNIKICLEFKDSLEGSTCNRKVIGIETRERSIYEWTCE